MTTNLDLPADVVDAHLAGLAASFRAGSVNALFMAIGFCGNQQIAMPEWVVAGYFKGMNRWWLYRCKTLDEAFGVQWPKGKSFEAARKGAITWKTRFCGRSRKLPARVSPLRRNCSPR